ncbi:MAG TPA: type II toxin-antitoxin system ParD family antitoxin [Tepidisphaeraceae bacterium]|nr:type II toxin-antitoxin system ParD family antitoxin [Tepidisphaeraceae bacterium]
MDVKLDPSAKKFIEEQISAGRFHSHDEVIGEAVSRMMAEAEFELDDQTAAAINRAEEALDRGRGINFETFAAEWRKKLGTP